MAPEPIKAYFPVGDFVHRPDALIKIGQIIHAARVALTGKETGFGLYETLAILGKAQSLARIDRALRQVKEQ